MRFSILIPTQDRPALLAVAVKYAMQLDYPDFEVIVSDNSTSEEWRVQNAEAVREYAGAANFRIVHPPKVLSPPANFEHALDFATGDYVSYLTDKMVILPGVLLVAAGIIRETNAEIVNWAGSAYYIEDIAVPSGAGRLVEESEFLAGGARGYDPRVALELKAGGGIPRNRQSTRDYAAGKVIFGCYSRELIGRIKSKSGTLFGGATHDYSAMIQALSMAKSCVMLNAYGVVFISLPVDKSLGSLTAAYSQQALKYYRSFDAAESLLSDLLIPGLYSSQHNMVAHDYKKFLPMFGNMGMFNEVNWLSAIFSDLTMSSKVWLDAAERESQLALFDRFVDRRGLRFRLRTKRAADWLAETALKSLYWGYARLLRRPIRPSFREIEAHLVRSRLLGGSAQSILRSCEQSSLEAAVQHIAASH